MDRLIGAAPIRGHPLVTVPTAATGRRRGAMVLTGAVQRRNTGHSRRRVLGTALATTGGGLLSGCGLFSDDDRTPDPPDPLLPLLTEAVALAAAYDRALLAQPGLATRLAPLAADHRAHAAELTRVTGTTAPSAPAPVPSAGAPSDGAPAILAGLRTAEQAAQKTAVAVCTRAPADRAALAGSIAACRATHAEVLR